MAELGYQCEFIHPVPEELYCKGCKLVARKIRLTTCSEEAYCCACIENVQSKAQPCPSCREKLITTFQFKKYRDKVNNLQVYCSMKERGCGWSGTLEQLDTHLDPHQDNCQYVDTECPLNCLKTIPKNNLDDHLAQHCTKRAYVCRHCSFKATYEEVVDTHLPQCKYVPLDCPNRCGATFERDFLEDHMKMCRLEQVECELRGVGCGGRFLREDQEEHARQNSQKHLTLTASLVVETKEQLQQKLLELDQRHKEEEEKLKRNIKEQEKMVLEQEKKLEEKLCVQEMVVAGQAVELGEQGNLLSVQKKKLDEQDKKLENQETRLGDLNRELEEPKRIKDQCNIQVDIQRKEIMELEKKVQALVQESKYQMQMISLEVVSLTRVFKMNNFSFEKSKDKLGDWRSPAMYTHVGGYKFCIGMDANGRDSGRGRGICVEVYAMPGEFDDQLKWPARARFTLELVNQQGGENASSSAEAYWNEPAASPHNLVLIARYQHVHIGVAGPAFIKHSSLKSFLVNDTLYFCLTKIERF